MLAVGEHLLGQVDDQTLRMMTALAGGLGGTHLELCGTLSAGALLIGALHGRILPEEDDSRCYQLASNYRERFIEEWGTTCCADLRALGYGSDGTIACSVLVSRAAAMLQEVLNGKG